MTTSHSYRLAAIFVAFAHAALAQQPPKPNESPRAVTLSLAEYNRLIDLASRPTHRSSATSSPDANRRRCSRFA